MRQAESENLQTPSGRSNPLKHFFRQGCVLDLCAAHGVYTFLFSVAVLAAPIHLMSLALFGISSSTLFTGAFHVFVLAAVIGTGLLAHWHKRFSLNWIDALFALFVACALVSVAVNFEPERVEAYGTFALFSVGSYLAGRLAVADAFTIIPRRVLYLAAWVVLAACLLTIPELVQTWEGGWRPVVLGFHHATIVFSFATGILLVTYVSSRYEGLWPKHGVLLLGLCAALIFLLSFVRFTFAALVATLLVLWLTTGRSQRKRIYWVGAGLAICLVLVFITRPAVVGFARLAVVTAGGALAAATASNPASVAAAATSDPAPAQSAPAQVQAPPSCSTPMNRANSVQQRVVLAQDALFFLPKAGMFGLGLDKFKSMLTCYRGLYPHNSALQVFVELGWLAGIAFCALLIVPVCLLFVGRPDYFQSFVAALFVFSVFLSFAHGSISGPSVLFLFLGATAASLRTSLYHTAASVSARITAPALR